MTWHYQATHRTVRGVGGRVEEVFDVREVYEGTWTEDAIAPASETKEGLIEVLQMMLRDVQEFDVLEVGE